MQARRNTEMKPNGRNGDLPTDVRRCGVTDFVWVGAQSVQGLDDPERSLGV
jgi:hypothetical protein